MVSIEYLEEERKKLWKKLLELEKDIKKKTPEYERDAKAASKKASEYRNKCNDARETANDYLSELKNKLLELDKLIVEIGNNKKFSSKRSQEIKGILESSNENLNKLIVKKEQMQMHLEQLESVFENHPELESEIEELNSAFSESEDLFAKISTLHKTSLNKKKEIDALYYEIIGYTDKNEETGEEIEVEGLKQELESTYEKLESGLEELKTNFTELKEHTKSDIESFIIDKETIFTENLNEWISKYDLISDKITNLLPNALTAGLSSAYSNKKTDEEKEQKKLVTRFNWGIIGLILVSLIPFLISLKSFSEGVELAEVINRMPRLVLAILPLYIPVMWVAYSSNKKMNLSKRLIEEYTHKEVISKTFEGLSKQIDNIEDSDISADLRLKLLYNILEVSSENPGKLISNYNKSDHPFMDALDKSVKLANAVDKLADIPGLSKLSKILDRRSQRILDDQAKKIETILKDTDDNDELEK